MRPYEEKTLAGAAEEVEKILNTMCGHFLGWSKLETECSHLTSLDRVDSAQNFQKKLDGFLRSMDRYIQLIQENLNSLKIIDRKLPMTDAGKAAARGRKYPTMGAICQFWDKKIISACALTDMAREVLREIPDHLARVEQLDKAMPGFQHAIHQYSIWNNAPVEKWDDKDFRQDFKDLMQDVKALMQGSAPRN